MCHTTALGLAKKVSAVSEKRLLPDPIVCRRYGVCSMTLWRWDHDPNLKFPKPLRIRGRKYRDQNELDAFDAVQVNNGATAREGLPQASSAKEGARRGRRLTILTDKPGRSSC
jgi:predicted DNA-binding transcriptional regulator AlpA